MEKIEHGLAVVMASQCAVGVMEGDRQAERAQGALMAIGLMLLNATDRDPDVVEALASPEHAKIVAEDDGSITIRYTPPTSTD